jgi:hypothetical protein
LTTLSGKLQSMLGGRDEGSEDSWRAVPKISVVAPPRERAVKPTVVLLVLVIVAELLFAQFQYRDYTSGKTAAEELTVEADDIASRLSLEEGDMANSETRIGEITAEIKAVIDGASAQDTARSELSKTYDELLIRPNWAGAFEAILLANSDEISIKSIRTDPSGKIEASGTATGITAISGLQSQFRSVADILNLISLQLDKAEGSQTFRAEIQIR